MHHRLLGRTDGSVDEKTILGIALYGECTSAPLTQKALDTRVRA